jgi:hypothetical protein
MNKKKMAIALEMIPVLSVLISFILIKIQYVSKITTWIVFITIVLAFLGFVFFLIGRKLYKDDKIVRILGTFDLLSTLYVVTLYIIAIFSFGL